MQSISNTSELQVISNQTLLKSLETAKNEFSQLWDDLGYKERFLTLENTEWEILNKTSFNLFSLLYKVESEDAVQNIDCFKYRKLDTVFLESLLMSVPDEEVILKEIQEEEGSLFEIAFYLLTVWRTSKFLFRKFPHICEYNQEVVLNCFVWIAKYSSLSDYDLTTILLKTFLIEESSVDD